MTDVKKVPGLTAQTLQMTLLLPVAAATVPAHRGGIQEPAWEPLRPSQTTLAAAPLQLAVVLTELNLTSDVAPPHPVVLEETLRRGAAVSTEAEEVRVVVPPGKEVEPQAAGVEAVKVEAGV